VRAWLARPARACCTRSSPTRRGSSRGCAASPRPPTRSAIVRRDPRERRHARVAAADRVSRAAAAAGEIDPGAPTVVLDRIQDPATSAACCAAPSRSASRRRSRSRHGIALVAEGRSRRDGRALRASSRRLGGATSLAALAVPLFGTSSHAALAIADAVLPWPCAWAFGHEGQGLADDVAARCRAVVAIPQPGGGESLNVAAAAAVCMYDTVRRRAG
jgi:TrmH family RNA methyltransferase